MISGHKLTLPLDYNITKLTATEHRFWPASHQDEIQFHPDNPSESGFLQRFSTCS